MPKYTVRQATATGKTDPKFGIEYIVHFNEDDREVKLSRQKEVEVGQEENGSIVNSKYGAYFKKDPYVPPKETPTTGTTDTPVSKAPYRRADNSDGQRQGMCFNNAANYVNDRSGEEPVDFDTWARTVFAYAQALYRLGNLDAPAPEASPVSVDDQIKTVANIFGPQG